MEISYNWSYARFTCYILRFFWRMNPGNFSFNHHPYVPQPWRLNLDVRSWHRLGLRANCEGGELKDSKQQMVQQILDLEKVGPWARNECFEWKETLPGFLATGNVFLLVWEKSIFGWKEATVSSQLVVKDVQEHQQQKRRFKKVDFLLIWPNSTVET